MPQEVLNEDGEKVLRFTGAEYVALPKRCNHSCICGCHEGRKITTHYHNEAKSEEICCGICDICEKNIPVFLDVIHHHVCHNPMTKAMVIWQE